MIKVFIRFGTWNKIVRLSYLNVHLIFCNLVSQKKLVLSFLDLHIFSVAEAKKEVYRYQDLEDGNQVAISSTFYEKLLRKQIPKAQKDSQVVSLFAFSGSVFIKSAYKHVGEIDPRPLFKRRSHKTLVKTNRLLES